MNNNTSNTLRIVHAIMNIVIVAVIIVTIYFLVDYVREYHRYWEPPYKENTIEFAVNELSRLTIYTREDQCVDPDNSKLQEYYALGNYYDACVHIGICNAIGDEDNKAYWEGVKNKASSRTGSVSEYKEEIDRVYGEKE